MKYFSHWQPLRDEDAHTALVFGFFRHAPTSIGLDVWLTRVLGRPVSAAGLAPPSFWPHLVSVVPGSSYTEPEIVLAANDPEPLTVVIEVKPGYGMHAIEQIRREVVDVASAHASSRVACIMVGADLSRPATTSGWETEVETAVAVHASHTVDVELYYSSFADAGRVITQVGISRPEWAEYAEDVVAQLRRKALIGYEGAPMFDDLKGCQSRTQSRCSTGRSWLLDSSISCSTVKRSSPHLDSRPTKRTSKCCAAEVRRFRLSRRIGL